MSQYAFKGQMKSCTTRRRVYRIDFARSLVLYVVAAGIVVTWCIPAEMSLRGLSAI
jgi:hypothetical protein